MMETVFYEENAAHYNNNYFTAGMNLNQLKRKMTLDLNSGVGGGGGNGKQQQSTVIKKSRMASLNTPLLSGPAVLSSPDLHKLNMSSPEFEKFVIQQTSTLPTPTPNQSQIFFPKNVTEEQEQYVRGFTDALSKLQQQKHAEHDNNNSIPNNINSNNSHPIVVVSTSNNSITSTTTNTSNNNNHIITIQTSIAPSTILQQPQQQQQLVQTTTATSTNNSSNIQLLNNPQQQQQQQHIQLQLIQQQPPPPPYNSSSYDDADTSDDDSDSMSENSCSNSTTSSSTYTTNGHVAVPTGFSSHHRLPEYQMSMGATGTSGNIPVSAATIGSYSPNVQIKEEPRGSSAPVSPIDMHTQEKIKLERKRQRNRVAASKCRKRKLERISKLEDKVKQLKGENTDLTNVLTKLRDTVSTLKQQVIEHINSGCQITGLTNQIVTSSSF